MSSLLWLLLYLTPLLGITAALFAWFGWQWRGSDMQKRLDELAAQIETAQAALRQAETDRATALAAASISSAPAPQDPAVAAELQTLRGDLKSAQSEARLHQDQAAKANEAAHALETEVARLQTDLEHLRAAHTSAQAELENLRTAPAPAAVETAEAPAPSPAHVAVETAEAPAKPKRKRAIPAKPKAATSTLHEKISVLEGQLTTHQTGLATLTQERDDWQRRITKLEGQTPADAAGLGLARRSLADSEKRLAIATTEIDKLRLQTQVLRRLEEGESALLTVPDDDLTQIKGIKKIISEQLRAHGIRTWRQIAQWNEDEQRAFSELLAFKNRATREQWQQQARALHEAAHGPLS